MRDACSRRQEGSVALSLCTAAHPLYTGFANICVPLCLNRQCDRTPGGEGRRRRGGRAAAGGARRARSRCRFAQPRIHFTPDSLPYSVPRFLKRPGDRTLLVDATACSLTSLIVHCLFIDATANAAGPQAGANSNASTVAQTPSGRLGNVQGEIYTGFRGLT